MKKIFIFDLGGTLVNANTLNEICGLNGNKEKSIEINKNAVKSEFHDVNALCKRINLMKEITITYIDRSNFLYVTLHKIKVSVRSKKNLA